MESIPWYGDLRERNTCRSLIDSLGKDLLDKIAGSVLGFLGTSVVVYEANGDYAAILLASGYCRFLDNASRKLCGTDDNSEALASGKWHCHESCWTQASKVSIETGAPFELSPCSGGINIYAVPVISKGNIIGSLNIGFGTPPKEEETLHKIAKNYGVEVGELRRVAEEYEVKSDSSIEAAKRNLEIMAELVALIYERKESEEKLLASKEFFSGTLNGLLTFVGVLEPDGKMIFVNDTPLKLAGLEQEDVIGKLFDETPWWSYSKEAQQTIRKYIEKCASGETFAKEIQAQMAGGDLMWLEFSMHPLRDETGLIRYLVPEGRDMTYRKKAEEKALSERDKLRGVLSALDHGVSIVCNDFIIEYQNKILAERFGDKTGQRCFTAYMGQNEPCEFCQMQKVLETGDVQSVEIFPPDGKYYDVSFSTFVDVDGKNKVIEIAKDITKKKIFQAEAMRTSHLASLGEMAAGVAHEINNPVTGVINYAQILLDRESGDAEQKDILGRIIKEGDRIAGIVKNLSTFARMEKEEARPALLQEILSNAIKLVGWQLEKGGTKVTVDMADDLPKIMCNSQEIEQVFVNLISNSQYALNKKYQMPSEDKKLFIHGEVVTLDSAIYLRTTFYDTGTGIPAKVLDQVFEPFFSTKSRGEGTGLGLSVSYGIIKNYHGNMWIESEEGEFTKVTFDLPIWHKEERESFQQ